MYPQKVHVPVRSTWPNIDHRAADFNTLVAVSWGDMKAWGWLFWEAQGSGSLHLDESDSILYFNKLVWQHYCRPPEYQSA